MWSSIVLSFKSQGLQRPFHHGVASPIKACPIVANRRPELVLGAASGSSQDHRRSRIHELAAVVFPDAKDIEANLVDNLIQQIVHALESAHGQTRGRVRDDCSEAV